MHRLFVIILLASLAIGTAPAASTLDIHFIDVEGGQATLIVTPSGKSMVVDAGWPGFNGRDADRIVAAARKAGLTQIDQFLLTHYHTDHVGGVPQLLERIRVAEFIDHGTNTEDNARAQEFSAAWQKAAATGKHRTVRPGDKIVLGEAELEIVTARGERIPKALSEAGKANPLCAAMQRKAEDKTENGQSVGFLLRFGTFRFVNLGDLTWNKELDLMCPETAIGPVDLYLTTHHGMNMSGPPAIVHALRPKVAIMNNGAKKGGSPDAWRVVKESPGLEDFWQLHFALAGGKENNSPEQFIANLEEACAGYGISVSASLDGGFSVVNHRNAFRKEYKRKK